MFNFRNYETGEELTDMVPFLTSPLHIAIVRTDFSYLTTSRIYHTHGAVMNASYPHEPNCSTAHVHTVGNSTDNSAFGPDVGFSFAFPYSGQYRIFAQTGLNDSKMVLLVFDVDVLYEMPTEEGLFHFCQKKSDFFFLFNLDSWPKIHNRIAH
jgi:hypothetical protein